MTTATPAQPPARLSRRERLAAAEHAQWQSLKRELLASLRELRELAEPSLQSPSLHAAALFRAPSLDEVPAAPDGPMPSPDDRSERAEAWRLQMASRVDALALRATYRRSNGMRPYHTWRRQGAAGERGGVRAGATAFPAAWTGYLLRTDSYADGWRSPLGVAWRRVEREWGPESARGGSSVHPAYAALAAYTDPALTFAGCRNKRETHARCLRAIPLRTGLSPRSASQWLDVGALRVYAEMTASVAGRKYARDELRRAEQAEAEAWQQRGGLPVKASH